MPSMVLQPKKGWSVVLVLLQYYLQDIGLKGQQVLAYNISRQHLQAQLAGAK